MRTQNGWKEVPLIELLDSLESGSRPKGGVRGIREGVPSIGGEHLTSAGGFDFTNLRYVPHKFFEGMKRGRIRVGDVLVVKDGATTGKVSIVTDDFPYEEAVVNEHIFVCRPGASVSADYLFVFLHSAEGQKRILEHFRGSAQGGINQAFAAETRVPLPPSEDIQAEIVGLLDTTKRAGQDAVDHLAQSRKALAQLRAAVFTAACSGDLTAEWREARGPEQVEEGPELSPRAQKYASGASNTNDLVEIPEGWRWWTLDSITDEVIDYRGRTPPSNRSGPIPHIRTSQIREGRIDWDRVDRWVTQEVYDKYMTRGLPRVGDVLFTMEAPMGEVAVVDRDDRFSIAQRILLLRPAPHVSGEYLALALQSSAVKQAIDNRATGSGVRGIAYKRFRSVVISVPPLGEQEQIVQVARRLTTATRGLTERVRAADRAVARALQAVAAKTFTGTDSNGKPAATG